jgi:hypothetical protein
MSFMRGSFMASTAGWMRLRMRLLYVLLLYVLLHMRLHVVLLHVLLLHRVLHPTGLRCGMSALAHTSCMLYRPGTGRIGGVVGDSILMNR